MYVYMFLYMFNQRSAARLHRWFHIAGVRMAYHKILQTVYKVAWLEGRLPLSH